MAKGSETKKTVETAPSGSVYLCVWRDDKKTPCAYGIDPVKATARKIADKARVKYEKKNGTDLMNVTVHVVKID